MVSSSYEWDVWKYIIHDEPIVESLGILIFFLLEA